MMETMTVLWKNAAGSWGAVAKSFHWVLALLILCQLTLGKIAEGVRLSPLKLDLFVWHKSIGVTILLLVILRLAWRVNHSPPSAPAGIPGWETKLARIGHISLYLLMFAVPLTGWWISDTSRIPFKAYWLVPVPDLMPADKSASELASDVHGALTALLMLVVLIHIAAALRHHFFLHNNILTRMLPWRGSTR
jgi:cytochrome b561